jgi:TolB protein
MHPDGSGVQPLSADVWVEYPAWSPDGRTLAFMAQTPEGSENYEIYVVNVDGSGLRRLTRSAGPDGWPQWSPDGRRILFASTRDNCRYSQARDCKTTGDIGPYHTLYVMNADGSDQHRLSDLYGQIPAWSPDGRHIAVEGQGGLTIMRADGTDPTLLPIDVSSPAFPDWIN